MIPLIIAVLTAPLLFIAISLLPWPDIPNVIFTSLNPFLNTLAQLDRYLPIHEIGSDLWILVWFLIVKKLYTILAALFNLFTGRGNAHELNTMTQDDRFREFFKK